MIVCGCYSYVYVLSLHGISQLSILRSCNLLLTTDQQQCPDGSLQCHVSKALTLRAQPLTERIVTNKTGTRDST